MVLSYICWLFLLSHLCLAYELPSTDDPDVDAIEVPCPGCISHPSSFPWLCFRLTLTCSWSAVDLHQPLMSKAHWQDRLGKSGLTQPVQKPSQQQTSSWTVIIPFLWCSLMQFKALKTNLPCTTWKKYAYSVFRMLRQQEQAVMVISVSNESICESVFTIKNSAELLVSFRTACPPMADCCGWLQLSQVASCHCKAHAATTLSPVIAEIMFCTEMQQAHHKDMTAALSALVCSSNPTLAHFSLLGSGLVNLGLLGVN